MFEKKISPFTAMIVVCDKKGDDHIGSGVLISANHILTCSHVVDNVKVIYIFLSVCFVSGLLL